MANKSEPQWAHIKGILFDKDGPLIDINETWLAPIQAAAKLVEQEAKLPDLAAFLLREGGYLPEINSWAQDSIIAFDTSEAMLDNWASHTSPALIDRLSPRIRDIVFKALSHPVPLIQNTPALFSKLAQQFYLGVASMDDAANVKQMLNGLNLADSVSFFCGADSGHGLKPDAGMVDAFCLAAKLKPNEILVIGDSLHDLKMAHAAGAAAIGVLCGASSKETLTPYADLLINDISELTPLLMPA